MGHGTNHIVHALLALSESERLARIRLGQQDNHRHVADLAQLQVLQGHVGRRLGRVHQDEGVVGHTARETGDGCLEVLSRDPPNP